MSKQTKTETQKELERRASMVEPLLSAQLGAAIGGFTDLGWNDEQIKERCDSLLYLIRSHAAQVASTHMQRTFIPIIDDLRARRESELHGALEALDGRDWQFCAVCKVLMTPDEQHVCEDCGALHPECASVKACEHGPELSRLDGQWNNAQPAKPILAGVSAFAGSTVGAKI